MSTTELVSFRGKIALLASIVGVTLLTPTTSASPIAPGFDLFTSSDLFASHDALGSDSLDNSLGAHIDLSSVEFCVRNSRRHLHDPRRRLDQPKSYAAHHLGTLAYPLVAKFTVAALPVHRLSSAPDRALIFPFFK